MIVAKQTWRNAGKEREFDGELKGEYLGDSVWLLHLSDRVSCDELYGSGYATISKEFDRRSSLFLPYSTLFREKTQKARLRRYYVFLVVLHREHTCSRCMCSHLLEASRKQNVTNKSSSHSFQSTNTKRLPILSHHRAQLVAEQGNNGAQRNGSHVWVRYAVSIMIGSKKVKRNK